MHEYTPVEGSASTGSVLSRYGRAALEYSASLGWLVTPARKKRPVVKWNREDLPAIPDRDTQHAWWYLSRCAQIALITGARSGVVAIDADPRHGGSLEWFYEKGWPRLTPTARSGGCVEGDAGGHAYYAYPEDGLGVPNAPQYATGCEVHGDGAIMILPPSLHHVTYRRYEWLEGRSPWDIPLAPIPDAILAELRERRTTRSSYTSVGALADVEGIDIGWSRKRVRAAASRFYRTALWKVRDCGEGRNDTLFWLSGQLYALGFSGYELSLWAEAFAVEVGGEA